MGKQKSKNKAMREAKAMIRKSAAMESIPTTDGLINPALSFDAGILTDAEFILVAAGYTERQAITAITTCINDMMHRAQKSAESAIKERGETE